MKKNNTYKLAKYFIYLLLISQLWSNVFSYLNFHNYDNNDLIEFTSNEKEVEGKKEFEDKIICSIVEAIAHNTKINTFFIHKEELLSVNFLKISTPPPEYLAYF